MHINKKELQTIRDTIAHWESDIRSLLAQGMRAHVDREGELRWEDGTLVKCYAQNSALCRMCVTASCEIDCSRCPYCRYHGISCNQRTSPWFAFVSEPTLETCDTMIGSLRALLIHAGNHQVKKKDAQEFRIDLKSGTVSISLN